MKQLFRLSLLLIVFLPITRIAAQTYTVETVPNPKANPSSRYVSDPTGIISDNIKLNIDAILERVEDSTTAQVAVVALPSIGDAIPKDFAHDLFQKWGIGYSGKDNGLLILLVVDQRRVEFETGYGLEGVLPDIVCARIQRERMVPYFKQGDYSTGLVNGVIAVQQILQNPESAQEIYDESKFGDVWDGDTLGGGELGVLSGLYSFFLLFLWFIRWIVRSVNPVKYEVDRALSRKKGQGWYGVIWYIAVPFAIAVGLGYAAGSLDISWGMFWWWLYAYLAFLIWDGRQKREQQFNELYENRDEPELYTRFRSFTRFYWFDALLFPIPMVLFWIRKRKRLHDIRYHPRQSPDGHPLYLVSSADKQRYLTDYQKVEEKLNTVQYDVWSHEASNYTKIIGYETSFGGIFSRCEKCHSKAVSLSSTEVIKAATTFATGLSKQNYICKACGHLTTKEVETPKIPVRTSSSSGGSSYSSSGGSSWSSGSSWGGGRSGGGGAGSSW